MKKIIFMIGVLMALSISGCTQNSQSYEDMQEKRIDFTIYVPKGWTIVSTELYADGAWLLSGECFSDPYPGQLTIYITKQFILFQ